MTQDQRLDLLVRRFLEESGEYRDLSPGDSPAEQRRLLRALMNVRAPCPLDPDTLAVQDAYLRERNGEKGIVSPRDLETAAEALGSARPFAGRLCLWQGDITRLAADAIVNVANSRMLGCFAPLHGCIDNCIHTYAGIQLRAECARRMANLRRRYGEDYEQPTAVPMLTGGYALPARHVIHVVGPIVADRLTPALEEDLAACYRNVLDLCLDNGLRTVAFCCISTGVFRFPNDRAAELAVDTVTRWLRGHEDGMDRIVFNVFKDEDRALYEALLR